MTKKLRVASRSSFLAKIQTYIVIQELKKKIKGLKFEEIYTSTSGDKNPGHQPWKDLGYGIFTGSLTKELLKNSFDCIVHSYKDLPVLKSKTDFVTIKRADPRDILLLEKTSLKKNKLILATSSPRRKSSTKELKKLLNKKNISSKMIRGNVTTRLDKVLNSKDYDGIFMAKAAIDRIYKYGNKVNKSETKKFINYFKKFTPIILPLSLFPTAASQGAIAVEFKNNDKKTKSLLNKINCKETLKVCHEERKLLKKYGGGCGLDIGITIENIKNNYFLFSKGIDAKSKKQFHQNKLLNKNKLKKTNFVFPKTINTYQMFDRQTSKLPRINKSTVILTRPDFNIKQLNKNNYFISSGVQTWHRLAKQNIFLQSSFDGLGEDYRFPEKHYRSFVPIKKITYKNSISTYKTKQISGYELIPAINYETIENLFEAKVFFWMSFSAFQLAVKIRPEILKFDHCSGPGSTYDQLKKHIPIKKLHLFFNYKDFKDSIYRVK